MTDAYRERQATNHSNVRRFAFEGTPYLVRKCEDCDGRGSNPGAHPYDEYNCESCEATGEVWA